MVFTEPRDQRGLREETWSTVPVTKNSRTIDPTKIPKISKVCSSCTQSCHAHNTSSAALWNMNDSLIMKQDKGDVKN